MKAIIDTDPGVDDAMAIFYAASCPEIDLIGLTTVFGNVPVEMATRNALHLAEMLGRPVPVAQGCARPLNDRGWKPVFWIHGEEGLGALEAPSPQAAPHPRHAVDFLIEQAERHKGELVLFPVGPLTNIAEAIRRAPAFARNVSRLYVMGGAVHVPGNATPFAEANIHNDPEAARIVLDSGIDTVLVGLDVTNRTNLSREEFAALAKRSPVHGGFLADIADFYIKLYESRGQQGCSLHDPATIVAAMHPELFDLEDGDIAVSLEGETVGQTVIGRKAGRQSVRAAVDGRTDAIIAAFIEGIARLP
ncbi:MAG: nucleoside hydrolase [Rhizobiales bacterium]|nr:nucleoside hydrolase [Hyphomicrobiales bacterium]